MTNIPAIQREQLRAARHEAGHWIIGKLEGFEVDEIRMTAYQAGCSISLDRPTPDLSSVKRWCEQRLRVLIAGTIAEHVKNGDFEDKKASKKWKAESTNERDVAKANELIALISNIEGGCTPNHRYSVLARHWAATAKLLLANEEVLDAVTTLVSRLPSGETATRDASNNFPKFAKCFSLPVHTMTKVRRLCGRII